MKLETFKSIILVLLIGMSLVLSFILWNFQPRYGTLQSRYVTETDIGGEEMSKRSVIKPKQVIFHKNNNYYSFHSRKEEQEFFEKMYDWNFSELSFTPPVRMDLTNEMIEVLFPLPIQLSYFQHVFSIEKAEELPNWSSDRMLIIPNKQLMVLDVYFLSLDGEHSMRLRVNNYGVFVELSGIFNRETHLMKYVSLETEDKKLYLPQKAQNYYRRSLAIDYIDPPLLVNALFRNPSLVSHTIGETNYNDGQRMMEVLNNGRSMEFTNPIESSELLSFYDLVHYTVEHINGHKGWTNNFVLDEVNTHLKRIQFKMYYDGYPIFSHEDYSMIEQRWEGQDLYQYKRPLFRLTNLLNSEQVSLPSGEEIVRYLTENDNYDIDQINDIRIGYRLIYEERTFSVRLEPTWYLKYNDRWTELTIDPINALDKEGA